MKPSALALAACTLLAGTAVHAQSSVTIGGYADASIGAVDNTVGTLNNLPAGKTSRVDSGSGKASRLNFRGQEDLGGGMKATFMLDQGFGIDAGTVSTVSGSNSGFNRGAWLGLSTGMGELRLGRMLTAYDALRGSLNQVDDASFAATGTVWGAGATAGQGQLAVGGSDYLARTNNTLYYRTPSQLGPFVASLSVALDEDSSTETASPRTVTAHAEYTLGNARLGFAQQNERYTTGTNRFSLLGLAYKLPAGRIVANLQRQTDSRVSGGQRSNEFQLGVDWAFTPTVMGYLGYASAATENAAGQTVVDAAGLGAMVKYVFSKRTNAYLGWRKVTVDRMGGSTAAQQTRYGVGLTHVF